MATAILHLTRNRTGLQSDCVDFLGNSCSESTFTGFGPTGAVVFNQSYTSGSSTACYPTSTCANTTIGQNITFTFTDAATGAAVNPTNLAISVFDITSQEQSSTSDACYDTKRSYWDAVGFDTTPTTITRSGPYTTSAGTGTIADPYHRVSNNQPSLSTNQVDTFTFANPGGNDLVMQYTDYGSKDGLQFIAVSGITFNAPC